MQGIKVFAAALVALVICGTGLAFASESAPTGESGLPTSEDVVGAIESESSTPTSPVKTDPEAAEGVPLEGLDRGEAVELLQGVFNSELQSAAGIFDELEVQRFLSPTVAVVTTDTPARGTASEAGEGGEPSGAGEPEAAPSEGEAKKSSAAAPEEDEKAGAQPAASGEGDPPVPTPMEGQGQLSGATLLNSTIPLGTEAPSGGREVVDLSLEHVEGELQPVNPLVEVDVPQQLGEGIDLPEQDVQIELADAPEGRAPSTVDSSVAVYPNIAQDTDLAVAPTPTGVETLTQVRSADSPHSETFKLKLPVGAMLEATEAGGAEVMRGDEMLVGVAPPTAIDATGAEVPVDLEVSGDSLTLTVSTEESTRFPVLLDPLFQTYEWMATNSGAGESLDSNREEWSPEEVAFHGFPHLIKLRDHVAELGPPPPLKHNMPGLYITAEGSLTAEESANWNYTVPRFFTDYEHYSARPTSFISHMTLSDLYFEALSSNLSPYLFAGIWDMYKPGWVSVYWHEGSTEHGLTNMGYQYQFPNENGDVNAKAASVQLHATETNSGANDTLYVGAASIELGDKDSPGIAEISGPPEWINQTAAPITFIVSDTGLGVYAVTTSTEGAPIRSWKTSYGCQGVGDAACPRTWKSTDAGHAPLKYEPALLSQGIDYLQVTAEDPVGNKSAPAYAQVKVDHTTPKLAVSGTITEQGMLGTKSPTYALSYTATDGEAESAAALSPFGNAETGNLQMKRPLGIATDGNGHVWMLDREANCVKEFDEEGHFIMQFGSTGQGNGQLQGPSNIVRTPSGNLWVTDTGNSRVEEFNASGQYLQQFGTKGAGGDAPYGIVADGEGRLWVGDVSKRHLDEYRENVTQESERFIREATTHGSITPAGLAVDSHNDVWVADSEHSRLQEYGPNGEYITEFGVKGSGNGQLNTPYNVAIAPSGNLLVTDAGNNRVEEFQPDGAFLRAFGSTGTANGQFSEPRGVAFGANNTAFVEDAGNHRIERWSHADYDPQSGVASTEVKVDGKAVEPKYAPGCSTKDCQISKEWTLESSNYAAGQHTLEVIATDGVGLQTSKSLSFELHPAPPSLTLSGSMTEQAALGNTRPRYTLQAEAAPNGQSGEVWTPTFVSAFGATGSGTGQLNGPRGVASDGKGHVWIVDRANNRVEEFNENGEYLGQFGSSGTGNGQFNEPWGIAVTPSGNLWVTDTENRRVEEFNGKGEFVQKFGTKASGASKGTELVQPEGIAVAPGGMIWVADNSGARIAEFRESVSSESERFVRNVATTGTGNPGLANPLGLAVDSSGNLWATDETANRVIEYSSEGAFLKTFSSYGTGNGQFDSAKGIGVGPSGNLYVVDKGNNRVEVFNPSGELLTKFGTTGTGNGQLSEPRGIAFGAGGAIFITDKGNNRVHRWGSPWEGPPTFFSAFGTTGSGTGQLNGPRGVASDGKGHVWIVDRANNRVEEFNEAGEYLGQFGSSGSGNGQFNNPWGIAVTSAGNLWVADTGNYRVQEFNAKGAFIQKFGTKAPSGSQGTELLEPEGIAVAPGGMLWITDCSGNRVAEFRETVSSESERFVRNATGTTIKLPMGVAVDPSGNLWVAEEGSNHLLEFNSEGGFIRSVGSTGSGNGQLNTPAGVGIGPSGNVYVVDLGNNRIDVFNRNGEFITKFGTAGTGNGNFSEPRAIAFGAGGAIFITDKGNNRVHRWGSPWEGPPTFVSAFGATGSGTGQLNGPRGVASDGKGHVWIVDRANNRVEEFNENGEYLGQFGSSGTGNGQFNEPWGIAVTPSGNLWVTDTENRRVEEFNGKGEFVQKFGTKASGASKGTELVQPEGIAVAPGGMIWVADNSGARIAEFRESVSSESERFVRNVATTGTGNPGLANPLGLAVDSSGNLWATDETANRVIEYSSEGAFLKTFSSYGTGNGQFDSAKGIGVGPSGNLYVVDKGNNRVEVFNPSGELLTKFGTTGTGNGQLSEPRGIAFGAGGAIFITDKGNNRVHRWLLAPTPDQIASVEVKVDGKAVSTTPLGCANPSCTLGREWILKSAEYLESHSVVVKATTASGWSTTKALAVEAHHDETAPSLEAGGALMKAPEGWVEQEGYGFTASATDGGYGVTSLLFKIDGKAVAATTNTCSDGGCKAEIAKSVDIAAYSGGAHQAELVATDGAGNIESKRWTINVDPEGHITATEAEATLEAVEGTSEATLVAPTNEVISAEERADGNDPNLVPNGDELNATGVPDPSGISTNPEEGFAVVLPDTMIEAKPTEIAVNPTEMVVAEDAAAVAGNTYSNVDTVIRPIFDGATTFSSIRNSTAPETFSWEVFLADDQTLDSIDPQDAEVDYEDGHRAFLISAEPAHDAIGTSVPTRLSVSAGNIITLTVEHQEASYVYPVVAGTGWEGGFVTEIVAGPKDELEIREEQERILREEQEAREHAAEEEAAPGDESPGEGLEEVHNTTGARPRHLRINVGPPEMYDWVTRKRRSKAESSYCASLTCDYWHTWEVGTWFWNGTYQHVGGDAWQGNTITRCYSHAGVLFSDKLITMGWSGPNPAPYGYGAHLNLWCNFHVEWFNITNHENNYYQIQDHLYGDGYQGQHIKEYSPYLEA